MFEEAYDNGFYAGQLDAEGAIMEEHTIELLNNPDRAGMGDFEYSYALGYTDGFNKVVCRIITGQA